MEFFMSVKKFVVRLTTDERGELRKLVKTGKAAAYKIRHANILLSADANRLGWTDEQIGEAYSVTSKTVANVRQRFVNGGLKSALERKKRETPPRQKVLDGEKEARLIAITRTTPPQGYSRWSLRLLSDQLVELKIVESISNETIRQTLKKTR
jgi:hypothetical protein